MGRKYSREPQGELDRLMIAMYDADIGMKGLIEDFPGIAEWTGSSDAG